MVLGDLAPIVIYLLWLNIIPSLNCASSSVLRAQVELTDA